MFNFMFLALIGISDICLLILYFTVFYKERKKEIPFVLYLLGFIVIESFSIFNLLNFLNIYSIIKIILNSFISILSTFILSFYYTASLSSRLFISISYHISLGAIEGLSVNFILPHLQHIIQTNADYTDIYVNFISNILSFIFILGLKILFNRKSVSQNMTYNFSVFVTPVISFILYITTPISLVLDKSNQYRLLIFYFMLIILNIVNYFLLNNIVQVIFLKEHEKVITKQLFFQTEKYNQLSSAYKATRGVVHDTKKHLFYIKDCIKNNTLDNIDNYIDTSVADIENSYSRINTGNLVIDAFISNYINMAKAEGIQLNTNIKINAKTIPVKDYDLCIIIGNLMDNSFNAVRKITNANSRHINIDLYTDDFQFVVHVKNTRVAVDAEKEKKIDPNEYYHGYGITNIINTSDKYKGVYSCYTESEIFETIIIYPIITDTELRRKLNIPENF